MTSQTTPQSSPTTSPFERKKALELKLKLQKEELAKLQAKIFNTHVKIQKLQYQKSPPQQKKKVVFKETNEVFEIFSDSGSEWSSDDEDSEFRQKESRTQQKKRVVFKETNEVFEIFSDSGSEWSSDDEHSELWSDDEISC